MHISWYKDELGTIKRCGRIVAKINCKVLCVYRGAGRLCVTPCLGSHINLALHNP